MIRAVIDTNLIVSYLLTQSDLARELVLRCQRHGRLAALEERVRGERPLLAVASG
jgi:predicted nucleic acid-binding protein